MVVCVVTAFLPVQLAVCGVLTASPAPINFVKYAITGIRVTNVLIMLNFKTTFASAAKTITITGQLIPASPATRFASIVPDRCSTTAKCAVRVPIFTMIVIYARRHVRLDSKPMINIGRVAVIPAQCFS